MVRVLVCGGRHYSDTESVYRELDLIAKSESIDSIIEGDCGGADRIAGSWARKNRVNNLKFPANWQAHGKAAGPIRNKKMIAFGRPDLVLAFPGGRGTADMTRQAKDAGIEVRAVE